MINTNTRFWNRPWIPAFGLVVLALLIMLSLDIFIRDNQQREEELRVLNHLSQLRARLEGIVNSNLLALYGLTAVIAVHPDMDQREFARIARELVENNKALRNIAAAPDLVISLLHPIEGNASVIGLDYRTHPTQKQAALQAVETGSMVVAGPLELIQGGLGVIARAPVHTGVGEDIGARRLWGLVSAVLDFGTLLKESGLDAPDAPFLVAVRGVDATGRDGKVFFGDADIFNRSPVWLDVTLPSGSWNMAAMPREGWGTTPTLLWIARTGGVLVSLLAGMALYQRIRGNLQQAKSAQALAASEARLNEAQRINRIGSWELDLATNRLCWSNEVYRIFKLDPGRLAPTYEGFLNLVHPDDRQRVNQLYTTTLDNQATADIHHRLLLPEGSIKYVNQRIKVVYQEDGLPLRAMGTIQDQTLQHRQEQEMQRLHAMLTALVEGSSDAIFIKDKQSRYLVANQALSNLIDKPVDIIIGADDFTLFPDHLAELFRADDMRIMELGEVSSYEESVITPTATLPFLTTKGPLIINGEVKGVFGIARDISPLKQAEERIKQSLAEARQREAELEAVFQAQPDLFFRIAADGAILDYRAQQASDLYIPPEAFLGKRIQDLLPKELGEMFEEKLAEVRTSGMMSTYEYDLAMPTGERHYEARLTELADSNELIAVVRDITEQHQSRLALHESERRLATLMGNLPGMAYRCRNDDFWTMEFVSDGCRALTGHEPCALLRSRELSFCDMVVPEDRGRIFSEVQQAVAAGRSFELVYQAQRKDGQLRWFWEKGQYISETTDGRDMLEGFITDITKLKRTEAALQQAHDELEQRVVERTMELLSANKELEAFTYSVSHDLREPLRAISGFSQVLLEEHADSLDAKARGYLDQVIKGGQCMKELIEGLLRLSRSTRGELVRLDLDLSAMAEEVLKELRNRQPERLLEVEIEPCLMAHGDPRLLRTVLENLLGNAWKYTGKTTRPMIRFSGEQVDGSRVYCIEDNGAGFDMHYAKNLFEPFQRLHQQNEFSGIGIGLATVQRIVQRHGGRIWSKGEEGRGATFYFTLQS